MNKEYLRNIQQLLENLENTQEQVIEQVAEACAECIYNGGLPYFFGTGHSHMICEEPFYRAGGLASIYPILETYKSRIPSPRRKKRCILMEQILKHKISRMSLSVFRLLTFEESTTETQYHQEPFVLLLPTITVPLSPLCRHCLMMPNHVLLNFGMIYLSLYSFF